MRSGRDHEGEGVPEPGSGDDAPHATPGRFIVSTDWRTGPRTRAWDELWRWLLAPDEVQSPGAAGVPASSDPER